MKIRDILIFALIFLVFVRVIISVASGTWLPPPPQPNDYDWSVTWYEVLDNEGTFGDVLGSEEWDAVDFKHDWGKDIVYAGEGDRVGFKAERSYEVVEAGTYRFSIKTDDGMRVYLDGDLIVDGWKLQGATSYYKDIELQEGKYEIVVEWFEWGEDAYAEFSIKLADGDGDGGDYDNPKVVVIATYHPWYRKGYFVEPYHEALMESGRRGGDTGTPVIPLYPSNPYNYGFHYDDVTKDLVRHQAQLAKDAGIVLAISWRSEANEPVGSGDPIDLVIEIFEEVGVYYFVMSLYSLTTAHDWSQAEHPKVYGKWNNEHWLRIDGKPVWNGAGVGVSEWSKKEKAAIEAITGQEMFYIGNVWHAMGAGGCLEDVDVIAEPWGPFYSPDTYDVDGGIYDDESCFARIEKICKHWSSLGRPWAAPLQPSMWHAGFLFNTEGDPSYIRRQFEIVNKYNEDQTIIWVTIYSWSEHYEQSGIEPNSVDNGRLLQEVKSQISNLNLSIIGLSFVNSGTAIIDTTILIFVVGVCVIYISAYRVK